MTQQSAVDQVSLPFAGIRVLDIASFIAAPVAATIFADYGADVIKIEPPQQGDPNRQTWELASYPKAGVNFPWEMDSRGKRSIAWARRFISFGEAERYSDYQLPASRT
ncbi:MAG: hypothetical protein EBT56_07840 [Betaproteobacteria bacterium]|nr:hypothetical protein [Betaproteobacteria bacterium]